VLLVARAIAAGDPPAGVLGSIHGVQPGSWLVGGATAPLLAFGVPDLIAARAVMLVVGMATVAICAVAAARWSASTAGAAVGAGAVAAAFAFGWPSWHHELTGLTGVTPESVPFQLAAVLLALGPRRLGGRAALLSGACVGLAALLSPAAWWTLLVVLVAWAVGAAAHGWRAAATRVGGALGGVLLAVVATGLAVPSGGEALLAFVGHATGQVGHNVTLAGSSPVAVVAGAARSLGVFAATDASAVRLSAGLLGALLVAGPPVVAAAAWRGRLPDRTTVPLVVAALSWALPLSRVSTEGSALEASARYFVVPLALGLVTVAAELGRATEGSGRRRAGVAAGALLLLAPGAVTLHRALADRPAPPDSVIEGLLFAGAHSLRPRPGRAPEEAFVWLWRHAPADGRAAYAQGYGMEVGLSIAGADREGRTASPWFRDFDDSLDAASRRALLVGVGCGFVVSEPSPGLQRLLSDLATDEVDPIFYGLGLCASSGKRLFGCDVAELRPSARGRDAFDAGIGEGARIPPRVAPGRGAQVSFPPIERLRPQPDRAGCRPDA